MTTPPTPATPSTAGHPPARSDEPVRLPNNGQDQGLMHLDGAIGVAWQQLGDDRHLAVDGHALGNLLTDLGEGIARRRHDTTHALARLRQLRDQLPAATHAAAVLDTAIARLDAPDRPEPALPAGTPEPLRTLMRELNAIPLVRRGTDTGRGDETAWHETDRLADLIHRWAAGELTRGDLAMGIRQLTLGRHELSEGFIELRAAASAALNTQRQWQRPAPDA
ncbi:hypothetical protein ACQEVZ_60755 [Dactylosporangium sp. CA-152071]|uniref:hypothetical protein n=1 Tax=Dactylosporangium sp. CA-152071 TaxID=3239933 RepID=UPI003D8EE164